MSTFLEVVELLLTNDDAKAAYTTNPEGFLDHHGLGTFDSDDVSNAMGHAADALPLPVAAQLDADAGLDSAVAVDLDDLGLTLEREPILDTQAPAPNLDPNDLDPNDLDSNDLDSAGFGDDVDFDTPEMAAEAPLDRSPNDIDDPGGPGPTIDSEAGLDLVDEIIEPETTSDDLSDELTELPIAALPTQPTLDDTSLSIDGTSDSLDDLDVDLNTDLPDDFDLLD